MKITPSSIVTALAILLSPTIVSAQVQINRIVFPTSVSSSTRYLSATLDVPQVNTSAPAYGGRMTVRHVYLAKIHEATYYQCHATNNRSWSTIVWRITTEGGAFFLSCADADRIAMRYGLMDTTETTNILYGQDLREIELSVLNITGEEKVSRWIGDINRIRFEF